MARNFEFRENDEFIQAQVQEAQLATRAALLKHNEPVDDNAHVDDDNADDDTHSIISDISYGGYDQMPAGFTIAFLYLQEKFNTQITTLIEKNNALQKSIESLEQKNEAQNLRIHKLEEQLNALKQSSGKQVEKIKTSTALINRQLGVTIDMLEQVKNRQQDQFTHIRNLAESLTSLCKSSKNIAVLTGTYTKDMTLPLPNGYIESQCLFYWASRENYYGANSGDVVPLFGNSRNAMLEYQGTKGWTNGAWMVIGIKDPELGKQLGLLIDNCINSNQLDDVDWKAIITSRAGVDEPVSAEIGSMMPEETVDDDVTQAPKLK